MVFLNKLLIFNPFYYEILSVVNFCNTFVLIGVSGLCLCLKKSLQRINPSFFSNQPYKKTVRLIAE